MANPLAFSRFGARGSVLARPGLSDEFRTGFAVVVQRAQLRIELHDSSDQIDRRVHTRMVVGNKTEHCGAEIAL